MRSGFLALLLVLALAPRIALGAGDAGDKKAPEHKVTQAKSYLMLEPIYTTIVGDDRPQGMLMVAIGLDVPDAGLRAIADRSLPVLRDAYLRNLMAFTASSVRTDEQPDVNEIALRLQAVTNRALGRKGARILLAQVALRLYPPDSGARP
ncbi:MAG: hypothetical protein ACREFW_11130 [Rhizomicrobium sp.]